MCGATGLGIDGGQGVPFMRTSITDMFGIDVPIFAFTHCRDVVVAVSKAERLEIALARSSC